MLLLLFFIQKFMHIDDSLLRQSINSIQTMNVLIDSQWLGFVVDVSYFFPMLHYHHLPHIKILELFCSFLKCITRNMNRIILKYLKWKRKNRTHFRWWRKMLKMDFTTYVLLQNYIWIMNDFLWIINWIEWGPLHSS